MKIKGIEYNIILKNELFDLHEFDQKVFDKGSYADGYTDVETKTIYLYIGENNNLKEVALHEVTHAFLYESGLKNYARNEVLCDWIAGNLEDILKFVNEEILFL